MLMEDNIESGGIPATVAREPEMVAREKIQPLKEKGVPDLNQREMNRTKTVTEALRRVRNFLSGQH
jgi:hypothetical protein